MASFETIVYEEIEAGVGLITLNRPERLNAMSMQLVEELHACLSTLEDLPSTRVLILTGAGRGFCSGTDLKQSRAGGDPGNQRDVSAGMRSQRRIADLVYHMRRIPQPIIAAINGVAAGGGFSFAMAADIRLAVPSARFVASFINVGLSAGDVGASYFLPRLIGLSRAAEILYTGRFVSAEEAERIGFVSRVVEPEHLIEEALRLARTMLAKSPFGLRMTKEILNQNIDAPSLEAALYLENRTQVLATMSGDFGEAIQAFSEKRPPAFTGPDARKI